MAGSHACEAIFLSADEGLDEALDLGESIEAEATEKGSGLDVNYLGERLSVDLGQLGCEWPGFEEGKEQVASEHRVWFEFTLPPLAV